MARRNSYRTGGSRRISRRERRDDLRTDEDRRADRKALARGLAPWATTFGGGLLVEMTHLAVSTSPALSSFATLSIAGTGAALGKFVSHLDSKAKADVDTKRLHLVNTAAITTGATMGTIVGLDNPATAGAWLVSGVGLSLANNLWGALHKRSAGEKTSKWAKLEDEIGLAKHEVEEAKSNGKGAVMVDIQAKDGATVDELDRKIPALASALRVGAGRITRTVDDDDSSRMGLRVQVADMLKDGVPWRGPSAFGASFGACPLNMGLYEDGENLLINIPGMLHDPQGLETGNVTHAVAQGTNGAGKTEALSTLVTDASTRSEVSFFLLDCAKPDQDYGHVRHVTGNGNGMWITEAKDVRRFFKQLAGPVIKDRTAYLAAKGLSKWEPGCGLNFLVIVCEESADYADGESYAKVLRTIRAAGGWVVSSIQRATHDQMDTTARSNHPAGIAFGMQDGAEASYILPPEAIEAGAFPGWGNRKPGYSYWAGGLGIPQDRWHITARTAHTERSTLAAAVTAGANVRTPLDETTARAFGPLWEKRVSFTTPLLPGSGIGDGAPPMPTTPPPAPAPAHHTDELDEFEDQEHDQDEDEGEEIEVDEETIARETEEIVTQFEELLRQDPEPGAYPDLTAETEIPPPADDAPTFALPTPAAEGDQLPTEQVRDLILGRLSEWFRSGKSSFAPKEVSDLWLRAALDDPRAWWNRLRKRLLSNGVIEDSEEYGEYDIVRDPLADNAE